MTIRCVWGNLGEMKSSRARQRAISLRKVGINEKLKLVGTIHQS